MAPTFAPSSFYDHPVIRECLEAHGFQRTSPVESSNGRATLRLESRVLVAVPGDGKRAWRCDTTQAPPEAIREVLNTVLSAASFLSQSALDRRAERQHAAKVALNRIVEGIREDPETHSSQQLRQFLWSLFNGHHVLNLWRLKGVLDSQGTSRALQVFTAWMNGDVSEEALRQALNDAGEMVRWDAIQLSAAERTGLDHAIDAVNEILRTTPPGIAHSALARAANLLRQAAETPPESRPPSAGVEPTF